MEMTYIDPVDMEVLPQEAEYFDPNAIYLCNKSNNPNPEYATNGASGMDLMAYLEDVQDKFMFNSEWKDGNIIIHPGGRVLIPTGLYMALPFGLEAQVRPRSGLALKHGITVLNSPGTIDCDFRGNIGIILINQGLEDFEVKNGDRIAQLVIMGYAKVLKFTEVDEVEKLPTSERMNGGFGSTGV